MQLLKLPHSVAVVVALAVFAGALYGLFEVTIAQFTTLAADEDFRHSLKAQVLHLREMLANESIYFAELDKLAEWSGEPTPPPAAAAGAVSGGGSSIVYINGSLDEKIVYELAELTGHLGLVTNLLGDLPFTMVMLLCMLFARQPVDAAMKTKPAHLMTTSEQIENQVGSYITSKFGLSLATGLLTWFFLQFFGIQLAVLFGILACVLNFIPSLGSVSLVQTRADAGTCIGTPRH